MLQTLLCLYLHLSSLQEPAHEVRFLQASLGPCLGLRMQPGPLSWAKSHRGQLENGAWGERTCMGNGARGQDKLPAVSLQIERVMGQCPATGTKGLQEASGVVEVVLAGR